MAVQVRKSGDQESQRRNSRERSVLVLVGVVWEQRKTDFDLDVVEGGRARGSFAPDKRESVSITRVLRPAT